MIGRNLGLLGNQRQQGIDNQNLNFMNTARQGLSTLGVEGPSQMPTLPEQAYQNANQNAQFMRQEGRALPTPVMEQGRPIPEQVQISPNASRGMGRRRQRMQQLMRNPRFRNMMRKRMMRRRRRPMGLNQLGMGYGRTR